MSSGDAGVSRDEASSSTSNNLFLGIRTHDSLAWSRFVELYSPLIYRWIRRTGIREAYAADIGQEVFLAVARSIGNFQREGPGGFHRWLWGVTRNKIREHCRSADVRQAGVGGSAALLQIQHLPCLTVVDDSSPPDAPSSNQVVVRRALTLIQTEFEQRTWQAFWQTVIDDRSGPDVAAALQMSAGAVRVAKHRVLKRLGEVLDGLLD